MKSSSQWGKQFSESSSEAARIYDKTLVPAMFVPWANFLVKTVNVFPGETVMDVACGTGSVTRTAAVVSGADGAVTGYDHSAAMLDIAKAKSPVSGSAIIDYHLASAEDLPAEDESCDVALCQQGLQFFEDRSAALSEMRRALRPGGRIGIAVWAELSACPASAALGAAIRQVCGDQVADCYVDEPWGLNSPGEIMQLLRGAGFSHVRVAPHVLPFTLLGGPDEFYLSLFASGIASRLHAMSDGERDELRKAVGVHLAPMVRDGVLHSETTVNLALGAAD
jgi:ubiquinone/menaquinone biosynthesis C-methylase UbiE